MTVRNPTKKSSATIVDIARAAGVSKSTVSLVLNGDRRVRAETRAHVEAAIDRLGYVYNRSAANLRGATSSLIGLVINDLTNPFFAELAAGIEDALFELGLVPILANTNENPDRQAQVLRSLREHGVAGIIMCPARGTDTWTLVNQLPASIPSSSRRVEFGHPPTLCGCGQSLWRAPGSRPSPAARLSAHRLSRRRSGDDNAQGTRGGLA